MQETYDVDKSDGEDDQGADKNEVRGEVGNFLTKLYADDNFKREREAYEKSIIEGTELKVESKSLLDEMDEFMSNLKNWQNTRDN